MAANELFIRYNPIFININNSGAFSSSFAFIPFHSLSHSTLVLFFRLFRFSCVIHTTFSSRKLSLLEPCISPSLSVFFEITCRNQGLIVFLSRTIVHWEMFYWVETLFKLQQQPINSERWKGVVPCRSEFECSIYTSSTFLWASLYVFASMCLSKIALEPEIPQKFIFFWIRCLVEYFRSMMWTFQSSQISSICYIWSLRPIHAYMISTSTGIIFRGWFQVIPINHLCRLMYLNIS